ncbi:MAG: right-handed parallel beta-helix repeat-containing protein [Terracidiphilus sp.]
MKKLHGKLLRRIQHFALALVFTTVTTSSAATLFVAKDGVDNSICGTKRDAACLTIQYTVANRSSAGDLLLIGRGVYPELIVVDRNLTLRGSSRDETILDGMHSGTVVTIPIGVTASIESMTIRNGFVTSSVPASLVAGISNAGTLSLFETIVTGNMASSAEIGFFPFSAGGVGNSGILNVSHSRIVSNSAAQVCFSSGGLVNLGSVTVEDSFFANNLLLPGPGGCTGPGTVPSASGFFNDGSAVVNTSTFQKNEITSTGPFTLNRSTVSDSDGFGIYNAGNLTVVNSTIYGNAFTGIDNALGVQIGSMDMSNSTVADNVGVGVVQQAGLGSTIRNSILAGNLGGDCSGDFISGDYNLIEDLAGCSLFGGGHDSTGLSPELGKLRENGGPTETLYPRKGSPAINGGNPAGCRNAAGYLLRTDQRGFPRPEPPYGRCDIGAVQVEAHRYDTF